jgi:thiamine kinase-like enzyme
MTTAELEEKYIAEYLSKVTQRPVQIEQIVELGGDSEGAAALKGFGYGRPLHITYLEGEQRKEGVLRRLNRNGFGREYASDRVGEVWRDFHAFNHLPRHIQAEDMVLIDKDGQLQSIAQAKELFLLTNYAPGRPYAEDLIRIADEENCNPLDVERAKSLAAYLADIHAVKHDDPLLWRRRLRDLIGHGEGIMGLTDSYPDNESVLATSGLRAIEEVANRWRWRLKPLTHRLSQVHGDFHPFNILFTEENDFTLLDRSRGMWGEPADDVSCLVINYLFFSVQWDGRLSGPFEELYNSFWNTYLECSEDLELLTVIAPWFAWRALVLASPQWYPTLTNDVRQKLLNFASNVMVDNTFNWQDINLYLRNG